MILDRILYNSITKALGGRGDGSPTLPYWTAEQLGLSKEPFSFVSGKWRLFGFRYYKGHVKPNALVVFFHGLGGGHASYMKQIALLAGAGYLVYAYDNSGSGISEGDAIHDLSQTLLDQKAFFAFLDKDEKAKGLRRFAMGHSWGGFTALASLQKEYGIEKVISLSGFHSVIDAMEFASPSIKKMRKTILSYQKRRFAPLGGLDVLDLMKKTSSKVLYIQGDKDEAVSFLTNYELFEKELADRPNIFLIRCKDRGHMPYWTKESERYFFKLTREDKVSSVDRDPNLKIDMGLLNVSDPEIEKTIIDFLGK